VIPVNESKRVSVSEYLSQKLPAVSFIQFLRCLQIESGRRIGNESLVENQSVRLVPDLELSFPAVELSSWTESTEKESRPRLAVSFFGLFGASGALPNHYTQRMIERAREKDYSLAEFLNIFNHRLLSLFYRAWEKHSFPVSFETSRFSNQESLSHQSLWALIQLRLPGSRNRLSVSDDSFLYYSGLFSQTRPTLESLRACVQDYLNLSCEIEPLVGQWLELDRRDQTAIGSVALGETTGNRLGQDTIAGSRFWDVEQRFRVRIGPTTWAAMESLLPTSKLLRKTNDLIRRLVGPEWDFDVQVLILADEVKGVRLGGNCQLGWNSWLGQWNRPEPADEATFEINDVE
jgi:type VI secretion system protein ImpH